MFLTYGAERYLEKHYKKEHLPSFSIVDGDKSIVYISLPGGHVVEGTHNCKFWVYKEVSESLPVFNYNRNRFSYRELTAGLNEKNISQGFPRCIADISHNGFWQAKAAMFLKRSEVPVDPSLLLTEREYQEYKKLGYL